MNLIPHQPCTDCGRNREGESVTMIDTPMWGVGTVSSDHGFVGGDGRHWLQIKIGDWKFYSPCYLVCVAAPSEEA